MLGRYGLGAVVADDTGDDGEGFSVEVMKPLKPSQEPLQRDKLTLNGSDASCTLILAKYDLRVEASIPLYIRQYVTEFQTQYPIAVMSYEDRGKFMSDVKGLHVYALPTDEGTIAADLEFEDFESCILFQLGRCLGLLHTIPAPDWMPTHSKRGCGTSLPSVEAALDHLQEAHMLSDSILSTLRSKLEQSKSFFESSQQLHQAIVHGLPGPQRVRLDVCGKFVSLCEWEDASVGAAVFDLAAAAIHWCAREKDQNVDVLKLRVILTGYHTARDLSPHEIQMLPEAIEIAILTRAIISLSNDSRDRSPLQQLRAMEDPDVSSSVVSVCSNLARSERHQFDLPVTVAYLNGCGMSPLPTSSAAIGQEFLMRKCKPWEDLESEQSLQGVRESFARLINANTCDITLTPSTSYAMSVAAKNIKLGHGQKVLVLDQQMASNVLPWQDACIHSGAELITVKKSKQGLWTPAIIEQLSDEDVAVCAIPNCHWADGALIDIMKVSKVCRSRGIILVLDLTQSAGVIPINVADIEPAFLCASVHKWLLGPYGASLLYVSPEYQGLEAVPLEYHENSRDVKEHPDWDIIGAKDDTSYPMLSKLDAMGMSCGGKPNPITMPMIRCSLDLVNSWQFENDKGQICSKASEWARPALQRIAACATSLGLDIPIEIAPHMVGIRIRDDDDRVSDQVEAMKQIYSHLKSSGIYCALRVKGLRVAYGLWNSWNEVERFCSALEEAFEAIIGVNGGHALERTQLPPDKSITQNNITTTTTATETTTVTDTNTATATATTTTTREKTKKSTDSKKKSIWYDIFYF